jgi:hypothetical protein
VLVEILSPKALVPEVIAVPENIVIDLFSNVPEATYQYLKKMWLKSISQL